MQIISSDYGYLYHLATSPVDSLGDNIYNGESMYMLVITRISGERGGIRVYIMG
jgi:hypothetical protein